MKVWHIFFSITFCTGWLSANTLEVCSTCPFHEIGPAIDRAKDGDVVIVHQGTYLVNKLEINKKIVLKGQNYPLLQGNGKEEILVLTADSITVEGFEFKKSGKSHLKDLSAIRVKQARHFSIINNRIYDAYFGIYIEKGKNGRIQDNYLVGNAKDEGSSGNAIHAWYADSIAINGNKVTGHRDGIYLEFVNHSQVVNNLSYGNLRYGLHFMFSNDDAYECNQFKSNGAGVAVMFSKRISMRGNIFEQNWGTAAYGLLLKEIYDADIVANQFIKNTIGIFVEGSARIHYHQNQFINNGWGIEMTGGCLDNNFNQNDFLTNTLDVVVNSKVNNNKFDRNYWSEYTGYDLDKDGIGDVPHRPVKLFSYILGLSSESIILLRSFFIDLLNFSEKVSPVFTPQLVFDASPLMEPFYDYNY